MRHFWDEELPPADWKPSDATLKRMREEPVVDLDLHLGGKEEEDSGRAWLANRTQASESTELSRAPDPAEEVNRLLTEAEDHSRAGLPDLAVPLLERAIAIVPDDHEVLLALCDALNAAKRGREAAQLLGKVIASFGNRRTKELALYHHRLARALAQFGDKNVALAELDTAFKIDPGSISVLRDLGVLAYETNDLDRAQKTFRALLLQRLDPNAGISKGEVFYYLGEISEKRGDRPKAVQMFERAIESDPGLESARMKLAELKH
jgi:tetratricopeptide (TPR) repeat protein